MLKNLLTIVTLMVTSFISFGQVTILDFETPETSTNFQFFGGAVEGVLNNVIPNPAPDAVNGSATVGDFSKVTDSPVWGGGFTEPNPTTPVDFTTANQICVKVHMPVAGTVALKLEQSTNGGDDWIRTVENSTPNVWQELCYDAGLPSIEGILTPATGNIYERVVLFFEFQSTVPEDRTYYFDDIIVQTGVATTEGDITFSVDMNDYAAPFTSVAVFGTFNSFDPAANPLTDNGDGTWSATVADIPVGAQEYLFIVDGMTAESMNSTDECTITDPSGEFTNRRLVVSGDASIPTVCFNSCYACGQSVEFTINVGTSNINVDANGIFVAGGGNFGNPGDFPMSDDDGDGVYSITLERSLGFESFYTFTNGICPDYSCKENITGQDCANPNNSDDRKLGPINTTTVINTCFGFCSDNTSCNGAGSSGNITFQLDMNGYAGAFTTAYIFGQFNNFDPAANPMTDDDGDGIWETTLSLIAGPTEYKFLADDLDEVFMMGDPCTITDPSGVFTNRLIEVEGDATVCFPWESCSMCTVGTNDLTIEENLFSVAPTLTTDHSIISFNPDFTGEKSIRVFNVVGEMIYAQTLATTADQYQIELADFANGIYMVHVQVGNLIATKKLMKF